MGNLIKKPEGSPYAFVVCVCAGYVGYCNAKGIGMDLGKALCLMTAPSLTSVPIEFFTRRNAQKRAQNHLKEIGDSIGTFFGAEDSLESRVIKPKTDFWNTLSNSTGIGLYNQIMAIGAYML